MTDILQIDVGTQPNQVPTVGDLGDLAFMDRAALDAKVTGVRQANANDVTADALMAVGAFGIGAANVLTEPDLNNYKTGGIYITPTSGLLNLPAGWTGSRFTLIVGSAWGGVNYCTQIIITSGWATNSPGKIAFRWMVTADNWSPWSELSQTNLLGSAATRNVGGGATDLMEVGAFGWGSSASVINTSNYDANTMTTTGWYTVTGSKVNFPENPTQNVLVLGNTMGSGRTIQITQTVNNGRYWIRCQNEGVWGTWNEIYTAAEGDQAWLTPTLTNSWTAYPNNTYPHQYRKAFGYVEIRGLVVNSGSVPTTTICTLPVGYRPARGYVFTTIASIGTVGLSLVYINVGSDGTVKPVLYQSGVTGAIQWLSLDGVRIPLN